LWANKAKGMRRLRAERYNPETKKHEQLFDDETGEPLFEKVPQRGHVGEKYPSENPQKRPSNAVHFLKHCGNEIRMNLVNAAAQLDPDTKHKQERLAKAKHFGWIRVGQCPLVLCMTGELQSSQLADKGMRESVIAKKAKPCQHGEYSERTPCDHYFAERTARIERKNKIQGKRDRQFAPDAQKALEAQKSQTTEIATEVAKAVANALKSSK